MRGTAVLIFFLCAGISKAQTTSTFSRNPRTFETVHAGLVTKGVAYACLNLYQIPDGLVCNPALSNTVSKSSLGTQVLISNGASAFSNIAEIVDGKVDQGTIDTIFSDGKIIQAETNVDIFFKSKIISGRYTPYSLRALSVVRNEANPDVELSAVEEKGFTFQSSYEFFQNFYAGLQVRILNRKFVIQQFKLISLATQDGEGLIAPKTQDVTYVEPGFHYVLSLPWKPRFSAFVANTGSYSKKYDEIKTPEELQVGIAISPPVFWSELDIMLDYKSLSYQESDFEKLRLGSVLRFGSMNVFGGIDTNGVSGGVFFALEKINSGVFYSTTKLTNGNEKYFTQTVYVEFGWQI